MQALLVSVQVVLCTEALCPNTAGDVADVRLCMPLAVFPEKR